jgi:two-component system, chemotaxis family, protein-glutamate methylesterase/glutaminase
VGPDVVAIGGSSGSLEALETLLSHLPESSTLAVIIAIHQHPRARGGLSEILGRWSKLPAVMITDKDPIEHGRVHVSPANYHVLVEADLSFALSSDAHVNFARPSIDVLFESAAHVLRERVIGVLLSGASADGARGLAAIRARGGKTACQDPATAREPTMPRSGCAATTVDWIAAPDALGRLLAKVSP